jgi:hypothetical protein
MARSYRLRSMQEGNNVGAGHARDNG